MTKIAISALVAALITAPSGLAAQQISSVSAELVAVQVDAAPTIDGVADEDIWSRATALVTRDSLAEADLTIKAVYSGDSIYFLASYPDADESRTHKTQVWVPEQDRYRIGFDREDTFVFKWSMEPGQVDLRVDADKPYRADIWFWKATRTDPLGYADDKMHVYSPIERPNSRTVLSKRGLRFFLDRPGDDGKSAYQTMVQTEHEGDQVPFYRPRQPKGSRADIRAKGVWRDGVWTVEFARKLVTNNADDIQFDIEHEYRFGVSRYEIAGRERNPKLEQPWYGAGEITGQLTMKFLNSIVANR